MALTIRWDSTDYGGVEEEPPPERGPKLGPLLPVGERGAPLPSDSGTTPEFSYVDKNDQLTEFDVNYLQYGTNWKEEDLARSLDSKLQGAATDNTDHLDPNLLAPSSVGEATQMPPALLEGDGNGKEESGTAGTDSTTSDTGKTLLRNASPRKCIGHPISEGTESGGTVGSHGQTEFSAARDLLRLHG